MKENDTGSDRSQRSILSQQEVWWMPFKQPSLPLHFEVHATRAEGARCHPRIGRISSFLKDLAPFFFLRKKRKQHKRIMGNLKGKLDKASAGQRPNSEPKRLDRIFFWCFHKYQLIHLTYEKQEDIK